MGLKGEKSRGPYLVTAGLGGLGDELEGSMSTVRPLLASSQ